MTSIANAFAALPPPRAGCRAVIGIPARDEAQRIGAALAALFAQRRLDGLSLDPDIYEVIVFVNGCSDATARIARRWGRRFPRHALHVVEGVAEAPECRHVGAARRTVMNAAAARLLAAGRPGGAVLTTDADSVVAPDWVAQNRKALHTVDAVTGRVVHDPLERSALPSALRAQLDAKNAYDFAIARLEAALDPQAHDPWPRHRQRCGPSIAVRAEAYVRAGGLPPRARLEDLAFYEGLLAVDARVRHSPHVRVTTSLRLTGRVAGGFGDEVAHLARLVLGGRTLRVEHPRLTVETIQTRATLRRWWRERRPAERDAVSASFRLDDALWNDLIAGAPSFGSAFAAAQARALAGGFARRYARTPIAEATATLQAYASRARASA